ncbi:M20/M25/M40 family metallo-hydrolase [Novosphingobium sp. Fuku2-ISO-50]|uniref:M20/M25/M40 family metallo-hydrolase n=1 Tax=Novosphingobium sp. Fuku2-ISO-50 TaxID=1739114 RepID=UPI0009E7CB57|nr:M20/M25/M40 family metallo-hydrolase [Novosphingobium sp. Fuku2-ISO-50]
MKLSALALTTSLLLAGAATAQQAPLLRKPALPGKPPLPGKQGAETPAPVDPAVAALRERALHDDTALEVVTGLTTEIGPRPDGSEAEGRARDWAVARLKALGFAHVHVEPFTLPAWQRGAESAAVVAPYAQPLHIAGLGNSAPTPPGGLTLPIAWFASFNDLLLAPVGSLQGKIAFVTNAMQPTQDASSYGSEGRARFMGPSEAARRGAAAIVIRSIGTDHSRAPHTGATDFAPGVTPIPAAALSVSDAENLERMVKLGQADNRPVMLHLELDDHQLGTRPSGNVIAEVPGTDPAAGVIVIGGHLDSWDLGTGAIDDGAGVAITTAAARLLMQAGPHRRTIRVVWFGDEETGGFGGQAYAKAHAGEPHALAAESDLGADRVWRFGTAFPDSAATVIPRLTAALAPLGVVHGGKLVDGGTDVEPMLALGTPGIDLNQSALRYFDVHHTAEDTLDRIDPDQLRQNVAAWTAMLAILADAPEALVAVKR